MLEKFTHTGLVYKLVLLFLIGESAWLIFTLLYTGLFTLLMQPPDGVGLSLTVIWNSLDIGSKIYFFGEFETVIIAILVSVLLLIRLRAAFYVYLINVLIFIGISADKINHLGGSRYGYTVAESMFGLIAGTIQVGLVTWGLWVICRPKINKLEA